MKRVRIENTKEIEEKYPIVIIDWEDHTADSGWVDDVDVIEPAYCRSIGWLIKETKSEYKVADCVTADSGQGGIQCILKRTVLDMWYVDMLDEG